jgi:hypothetical protein
MAETAKVDEDAGTIELTQITTLMCEVAAENAWKRGKRQHMVATRDIFGIVLSVRQKSNHIALCADNWRIHFDFEWGSNRGLKDEFVTAIHLPHIHYPVVRTTKYAGRGKPGGKQPASEPETVIAPSCITKRISNATGLCSNSSLPNGRTMSPTEIAGIYNFVRTTAGFRWRVRTDIAGMMIYADRWKSEGRTAYVLGRETFGDPWFVRFHLIDGTDDESKIAIRQRITPGGWGFDTFRGNLEVLQIGGDYEAYKHDAALLRMFSSVWEDRHAD